MKKLLFACALLATFGLQAAASPRYLHKTSITQKKGDDGQIQYLAQFKIDKVVDEKTPPVEFTAPQLLCQAGQEAVVSKKGGDGSYIVKTLIYKADNKTKAKTVILIFENDQNVFTSIEDFDVLE